MISWLRLQMQFCRKVLSEPLSPDFEWLMGPIGVGIARLDDLVEQEKLQSLSVLCSVGHSLVLLG